jgi:hypothetical protein
MAPAEVDFAWYISQNASWMDESMDELFDDARNALGERLNPRAMDLALIGAFVQRVAQLVLAATGERPTPPETDSARARPRLA